MTFWSSEESFFEKEKVIPNTLMSSEKNILNKTILVNLITKWICQLNNTIRRNIYHFRIWSCELYLINPISPFFIIETDWLLLNRFFLKKKNIEKYTLLTYFWSSEESFFEKEKVIWFRIKFLVIFCFAQIVISEITFAIKRHAKKSQVISV